LALLGPTARRVPSALRRAALAGAVFLVSLATASPARADDDEPLPPRAASFEWDADQRFLYASLSYRDVMDAELRKKLQRGLPTTIVFSAAVYAVGIKDPVATTVQSCKITWHVWEEAYRVDMTQPGTQKSTWTTTVDGVLRRCADARRLLIANRNQLAPGQKVYLDGRVLVNPVSPQLLEKIKRWVSRPTATGTAAPGDALFGTFTGLFLQRIGDAERVLQFLTTSSVPRVVPKEAR
jgi:hypothetical protein